MSYRCKTNMQESPACTGDFARLLSRQGAALNPYLCAGCCSCSSACPASGIHGMDPQKFIRLMVLGRNRDVLNTEWLWTCALCHNCILSCPLGIDIPTAVYTARRLQPYHAIPGTLQAMVGASNTTGNSIGKSPGWFLKLLRGIQGKLETVCDIEDPAIPIDKKGADVLLLTNTRLLQIKTDILASYAKIFHTAGEKWTMSSFAPDTFCPAFLAGNSYGEKIWAERISRICADLEIKTCVIDDCANPFAPFGAGNFRKKDSGLPFEVISSLELVYRYLEKGRIALNPSILKSTVTLHDPCKVERTRELLEFPRTLLEFFAQDFVEMDRMKKDSVCCGGTLLASGMEQDAMAFGKWKADQLRRSGAGTVAVLCKTCYMQMERLAHFYGLSCKVAFLPHLIGMAVKPAEKPHIP